MRNPPALDDGYQLRRGLAEAGRSNIWRPAKAGPTSGCRRRGRRRDRLRAAASTRANTVCRIRKKQIRIRIPLVPYPPPFRELLLPRIEQHLERAAVTPRRVSERQLRAEARPRGKIPRSSSNHIVPGAERHPGAEQKCWRISRARTAIAWSAARRSAPTPLTSIVTSDAIFEFDIIRRRSPGSEAARDQEGVDYMTASGSRWHETVRSRGRRNRRR